MPSSNSVITFPSAAKFNKGYLEYAYVKGTFKIDDEFTLKFNLGGNDFTTKRNKFQMLEFMDLVEFVNGEFKITSEGKRYYESGYDVKVLIDILTDSTLPYTQSARYMLTDKNYKFMKVLFEIFNVFYKYNLSINAVSFEHVFCNLLNDDNYNNVNKLIHLLLENYTIKIEEIGRARATIDYLFSSFVEMGILIKNADSTYSVKEVVSEVVEYVTNSNELTIEVLAAKLKQEYEEETNDKMAVIHLFGIKYANVIIENKYSLSKIIELAGMKESLVVELRTGVKLYPRLIELKNKEMCLEGKVYQYDSSVKSGVNLIVYGTPGCGKSYYVEHNLLKDYPKEGNQFTTVIRTTFYQDYTNTDFVGQVLPRVDSNKSVTYEFNPGPFTIALKTALENSDKPVALVIEELNRGNAASIFGDIFQLLDRDGAGKSEYEIHNVNIQDYLNKQLHNKGTFSGIRIPSNLSVIATMNTSDQNVFTLDTAFKRRWDFEKLANRFDKNHPYASYLVPGMSDCNWYAIVNAINDYIVEKQNSLTSEDKQIGVFFVKESMLINPKTESDDGTKTKKFAYKMIEYLWNDVAKYNNRNDWFNGAKTLDEALEQYENPNKQAFNDELIKKIREHMDEYNKKYKKEITVQEGNNNG